MEWWIWLRMFHIWGPWSWWFYSGSVADVPLYFKQIIDLYKILQWLGWSGLCGGVGGGGGGYNKGFIQPAGDWRQLGRRQPGSTCQLLDSPSVKGHMPWSDASYTHPPFQHLTPPLPTPTHPRRNKLLKCSNLRWSHALMSSFLIPVGLYNIVSAKLVKWRHDLNWSLN